MCEKHSNFPKLFSQTLWGGLTGFPKSSPSPHLPHNSKTTWSTIRLSNFYNVHPRWLAGTKESLSLFMKGPLFHRHHSSTVNNCKLVFRQDLTDWYLEIMLASTLKSSIRRWKVLPWRDARKVYWRSCRLTEIVGRVRVFFSEVGRLEVSNHGLLELSPYTKARFEFKSYLLVLCSLGKISGDSTLDRHPVIWVWFSFPDDRLWEHAQMFN